MLGKIWHIRMLGLLAPHPMTTAVLSTIVDIYNGVAVTITTMGHKNKALHPFAWM